MRTHSLRGALTGDEASGTQTWVPGRRRRIYTEKLTEFASQQACLRLENLSSGRGLKRNASSSNKQRLSENCGRGCTRAGTPSVLSGADVNLDVGSLSSGSRGLNARRGSRRGDAKPKM